MIETVDEQRVIECFQHVIAQALYPLWRWTLTDGLERLDFNGPRDQEVAPDATTTLTAIRDAEQRGIYLLFDFQSCLQYAMAQRQMREIVQRERSAAHTLVLVGAKVELPPELDALATRVPLALPDIKELAGILRGEAAAWQRESNRALNVDNDAARTIVRNLLGLTAPDARRIVRKLIYNDGALNANDLPELMQAKFDLLNRSRSAALRVRHSQLCRCSRGQPCARLGATAARGLSRSQPGARTRSAQGRVCCLACKVAARAWRRRPSPAASVCRLFDWISVRCTTNTKVRRRRICAKHCRAAKCWLHAYCGSMKSKKVWRAAVTMAACHGAYSGYLLTWMAERKAKVFVVATANAVHELPAELLRKGRFDEIFFVDLPRTEVRAAIFAMHLKRRKLIADAFDLNALAEASDGFSGAEIEQAVVSALYDASGNNHAARSGDAAQRATRNQAAFRADARASRRTARMG